MINTTPKTVTINQKTSQSDPATSAPVLFTVTFSTPINPTTFTIADISTVGSTATGITVNSITEVAPNNGTVFEVAISATGAGTIIASIPLTSGLYISTILGTTGEAPRGIVRDTAGNIYTANVVDNNITKITPDGVSSVFATTGEAPHDITIDSAGNMYTANAGSNNVSKITPTGASSILGTTGLYPRSITIDPSGNIYTANSFSHNVSKITP